MTAGATAADAATPPVTAPAEITRRSFAIIRREAALHRVPPALAPVVVRLIHSCGMVDLVDDLRWGGAVVDAARSALADGAPVLVDAAMVAAGITRARLPADNQIICRIDDPVVPSRAAAEGTTRSAAAVDLWAPLIAGTVVAIGNAPTALARLLTRLDDGWPRPAAILGFPVGFVGAVEAKAALAADPRGAPFLTVLGRRGGSALAAAAVNALAGLAAGLDEATGTPVGTASGAGAGGGA